MKKNIIFVKNYYTKCFIGIYPKERKKKQPIKLSVKLYIKINNDLDKISSTVSYENILKYLEEITHYNHINLVETLATKLSCKFEKINNVEKIIIKIVKCNISKKETDVGFILKNSVKNNG